MKQLRYNKNFCLEVRPYGNYCPHNCDFCYQRKGAALYSLDNRVALKVFKSVLSHAIANKIPEVTVVFHGGEPLHDGGAKVCELVDLFNNAASDVRDALQVVFSSHTSGFSTLNLEDIKKRNIYLCYNRHIPELQSKDYTLYHENVNAAFKKGILYKQIITVTQQTLLHPHDCVMAIEEHHLPTKFIREFPSHVNRTPEPKACPTLEQMLDFYTAIIEIATKHNLNLSRVEPFNAYLTHDFSLRGCRFTDACPFSNGLLRSLALDNDGTIYPCNRFAGIKEFQLFKVSDNDDPLMEKLNESIRQIQTKYHFRESQCNHCVAEQIGCGMSGGCPFFAYIYDVSRDPMCELENIMARAFCD